MKQLTNQLKSGDLNIQEVPMPLLGKGMVLVRNHYSLISAGTEGSTVKTARKSLIGKAKERPQQVKQVLQVLQQQGPVQTYRAVMKKLDAYSPLGYSCAGEVIAVGAGVTGFTVGDRVACAGAGYANHAEVVQVPVNLCVRLPKEADLAKAAYNTLGAIAMQGLRQADLRLGESCAVIGLGLLGQLSVQLLKASGVEVFGIDIDPKVVALSKEKAGIPAWERSTSGLEALLLDATNGQGVDSVIITAATSSLDPINFAGQICRKKGKVVVVGAVPTGFEREKYYRKELDLRMSCSYGPGRYDLEYEEKGYDYPYAYVRWTENRNMQAFQELVHRQLLNLDYLTTHTVTIEEAPNAYDMIVNRSESFLGILIQYDTNSPLLSERVITNNPEKPEKIGVGFIGVGSYAQSHLLPNLPQQGISRVGILSNSGTSSKKVAEKFGFQYCTDSLEDLMKDDPLNTVFIATRHDSHAPYVLAALQQQKHVFVEKPLCLQPEELESIKAAYEASGSQLMVGFNRRFAPLVQRIRKQLNDGPLSMVYRINAGVIPKDTWIQDMELGGGRVIGEVCHFIDLCLYLIQSRITQIQAQALPDANGLQDTLSIQLQFQNGSIASIHYFANGSKALPKEYLEVYQSGFTALLHDFKQAELYGKSKTKLKKISQNKGQAQMVQAFFGALAQGKAAPIPAQELFEVTEVTFKVLEAIKTGETVKAR